MLRLSGWWKRARRGFFWNTAVSINFFLAIRRVARGELWFDPAAFRVFLAGKGSPAETDDRMRPLTARQSQVLRGVLDGLTNKEIALSLNVSESSVKAVIQELFQKAGVRTRSQLVRIAIEKHSSDWLKPHAQGWWKDRIIAIRIWQNAMREHLSLLLCGRRKKCQPKC
jgi:DNA-binding CsgD family transcriptional regulator